MKRKTVKVNCLFLICAALVFVAGGTMKSHLPYDMKAITTVYSLNEVFLEENRTLGVRYSVYEEFTDEFGSVQKKEVAYEFENDAPSTRYFIAKNQDDFNMAFKSFDEEIDFTREMLVIYLFTAFNSYVTKVADFNGYVDDENVLHLNFGYKHDTTGCAVGLIAEAQTAPSTQAHITVKMNRTTINNVTRDFK